MWSQGPPATGLTAQGLLCLGATVLATDVASAAIRAGGAGGPALLFATRKSLLYVAFLGQLMPAAAAAMSVVGDMPPNCVGSLERATMHQAYQHKELLAVDSSRPRQEL